MDKRIPIILLSLILITLTGCSKPEPTTEVNQSSLILQDIFQSQYSVSLFQFGKIMQKLSEAQSEEDFLYIRGMMDMYLSGNPRLIPNTILNEKKVSDVFLDADLQTEILQLFEHITAYTSTIQSLVEKNKVDALKMKADEFHTLYQFERELNDSRLYQAEEVTAYKQRVKEMNELLQTLLPTP